MEDDIKTERYSPIAPESCNRSYLSSSPPPRRRAKVQRAPTPMPRSTPPPTSPTSEDEYYGRSRRSSELPLVKPAPSPYSFFGSSVNRDLAPFPLRSSSFSMDIESPQEPPACAPLSLEPVLAVSSPSSSACRMSEDEFQTKPPATPSAEDSHFDIDDYLLQWQDDVFVPDERYFPHGFGGIPTWEAPTPAALWRLKPGPTWATTATPARTPSPLCTLEDCVQIQGERNTVTRPDTFMQLVNAGAIDLADLHNYKHLVFAAMPSPSGVGELQASRTSLSGRLFPSIETLAFVGEARCALMRMSREFIDRAARQLPRLPEEKAQRQRAEAAEKHAWEHMRRYFAKLSLIGKPNTLCFDFDFSTQGDHLLRAGMSMLQEVWRSLQAVHIHCVLNVLPLVLPGLVHHCHYHSHSYPFHTQGASVPILTSYGQRVAQRMLPEGKDELRWAEVDLLLPRSADFSTENNQYYSRIPVSREFAKKCLSSAGDFQNLGADQKSTLWVLHCPPIDDRDQRKLLKDIDTYANDKLLTATSYSSGQTDDKAFQVVTRANEQVICPACAWSSEGALLTHPSAPTADHHLVDGSVIPLTPSSSSSISETSDLSPLQ